MRPPLDPLPLPTITIGLTSSYLRLQTSEGKSSFTKSDWEEKAPCWVEQTIFDQNMKDLLAKKKSIKLAEQRPNGMTPSTPNNVGSRNNTKNTEKRETKHLLLGWKDSELESKESRIQCFNFVKSTWISSLWSTKEQWVNGQRGGTSIWCSVFWFWRPNPKEPWVQK